MASLAGGGPTQLFNLVETLRARRQAQGAAQNVEAGGEEMYEAWKKIQADPSSTTKFLMGHPYRRWSSFLVSSVLAELLRCKARIYIAHGTNDQANPVAGFDMLRAELVVRGRDVRAERIEGGGHNFAQEAADYNPMRSVMGRVASWFSEADANTAAK